MGSTACDRFLGESCSPCSISLALPDDPRLLFPGGSSVRAAGTASWQSVTGRVKIAKSGRADPCFGLDTCLSRTAAAVGSRCVVERSEIGVADAHDDLIAILWPEGSRVAQSDSEEDVRAAVRVEGLAGRADKIGGVTEGTMAIDGQMTALPVLNPVLLFCTRTPYLNCLLV